MSLEKRLLLEELIERSEGRRAAIDILSSAFPKQKAFIKDKARLKVLFCTRRAAKSYTAGLDLVEDALTHPGCNCLFIGLTRASAHGIIWKDILKDINTRHKLNIRFNETYLTATFPNGSIIWVTGADANESDMNKLLGKKYRKVAIDEASMYSINMRQLVYGILKPATADHRGTICLYGTSSNIATGLFYDITMNLEPGWSVHQWSAHDNPHIAVQWAEELEDIRLNRPDFMKTPLFKQWYLNEWVVDDDAKVYKYSEERNRSLQLPHGVEGFRYILGVDLAHSPDSSAFVVGAYTESWPELFLVYAKKFLKMDVTDAALKVKELDKIYNFDVRVVDGQNKMAVAEMNTRHNTQLIPADKIGKVDFINIMNSEFIMGKIKVLPGARDIEPEYKTLVWQTDNGKVLEPKKEHPGLHNDLSDAALYMWRHAYQYLWHPIDVQPKPGSLESWEPQHLKRMAEIVRKEKNPDELEIDFDPDLFTEGDE